MWNQNKIKTKNQQTCKQTKIKLIDTENRLVVVRGQGGWVNWVKEGQRYKYPVIK